MKDVVEDPHIAVSRGMVVDAMQPRVGPVKLLNSPVKMSETKPKPRGPAPALGEDMEEVLMKILGMTREDVGILSRQGAI